MAEEHGVDLGARRPGAGVADACAKATCCRSPAGGSRRRRQPSRAGARPGIFRAGTTASRTRWSRPSRVRQADRRAHDPLAADGGAHDDRGRRRPERGGPRARAELNAARARSRRGEALLPAADRPRHLRGARRVPRPQLDLPRERDDPLERGQPRHRGRHRGGPAGAGDPPAASASPRPRSATRSPTSPSAPAPQARPRRPRRRHLHDLQPRLGRRRLGAGDHQPAPGRDPRRADDPASPLGGHRTPRARRRSRSARSSASPSPSTTAPSTAPTPPASRSRSRSCSSAGRRPRTDKLPRWPSAR